MEFSRQEYWSALPFPSPKANVGPSAPDPTPPQKSALRHWAVCKKKWNSSAFSWRTTQTTLNPMLMKTSNRGWRWIPSNGGMPSFVHLNPFASPQLEGEGLLGARWSRPQRSGKCYSLARAIGFFPLSSLSFLHVCLFSELAPTFRVDWKMQFECSTEQKALIWSSCCCC